MKITINRFGVAGTSLSQIKDSIISTPPTADFVVFEGGINTINNAVVNPIAQMKIDLAAGIAAIGLTTYCIFTVTPFKGFVSGDRF